MHSIGILKTDNVHKSLSPKFGEYPDMFAAIFRAQMPNITINTYDVELFEYPENIDEVDAYVITGSAASVYNEYDWIYKLGEFLIDLNNKQKKTIGICFGHQLAAQVLGGKTEMSDKGWGIGMHTYELTDSGREFMNLSQNLNVFSTHKDQVIIPAEGSETLAGNEFCPIAISKIGNHFLSIQGHIEMEIEYYKGLLSMRQHLYGEELYQKAMDSLNQRNDHELLTQMIVDFIWEK